MKHAVLLALLALVALAACRKDPALEEPLTTGPTPLVLQIPTYITDSGHYPHVVPNNPLTVEGVELGRRLFHEKGLSNDYSMSCASCHLQENAFSDPRRFSIGTNGATGHRQAMAVVNLAFDHFLFWDGRVETLEEQAARPVIDPAEMRNTWPTVVARLQALPAYAPLFEKAFGSPGIDSARVGMAIAQFERTLLSFDSRYDRYTYGGDMGAMTEQELRGQDVFFRRGHCVDCHRAPLFADHAMRNNGLDSVFTDLGMGAVTGVASHNGRFKVPTLRNIGVTAPYMHDGRFNTLEEVVDFYADDVHTNTPFLDNHMEPWLAGQVNLSAQDRADLVAFLHTLTDQSFLTNPTFSDPH